MAGHFRMPLEAVGKNDGYFHDVHALAPEPMRHLDLKTVTIRTHIIEAERLQRASPETFVAAGRVGKGHSRNDLDVFSGALAEDQPAERPVDDPNPVHVTRTNHELGFARRLQKHRYIVGIMGKIAVEFENKLKAMLQRPFK